MKKSVYIISSLVFVIAINLNIQSTNKSHVSKTIDYKKNQWSSIFAVNTNKNHHVAFDNYVVYGNYSSFSKTLLESLINDHEKICIFYDIYLSDNDHSDYDIMKNHAVIYYYENGISHADSLKSSTKDSEELIDEINNFIFEKLNKIKFLNISVSAFSSISSDIDTSLFTTLYNRSYRDTNKPYGYIDIDFNVMKYRANNVSSLYIIDSHVSFTPGSVASGLDAAGFGEWLNKGGYIKLKASPAFNEVGYNQIRIGGTPVFKDAYPVNQPGQIAIGSSYSIGLNLGYSFKNGFSLTNASTEAGVDMGLNISYGYSKVYTTTEPALSAQKDPDDDQKYTWLFTYATARKETHHLYFGYIFEMNNKGHSLLEGDVAFNYEYKMTIRGENKYGVKENVDFKSNRFYNFY